MEFVSPYVLKLYSPVYDIYTLVGLLGCGPIISQGILTQLYVYYLYSLVQNHLDLYQAGVKYRVWDERMWL